MPMDKEIEMRLNIQDKWIVQLLECINHLSHRYHKLKREIRKLKKETRNKNDCGR